MWETNVAKLHLVTSTYSICKYVVCTRFVIYPDVSHLPSISMVIINCFLDLSLSYSRNYCLLHQTTQWLFWLQYMPCLNNCCVWTPNFFLQCQCFFASIILPSIRSFYIWDVCKIAIRHAFELPDFFVCPWCHLLSPPDLKGDET